MDGGEDARMAYLQQKGEWAQAQTHMSTHTHTHSLTHSLTHTHTHSLTHTHTHSHVYKQMHNCAYTHVQWTYTYVYQDLQEDAYVFSSDRCRYMSSAQTGVDSRQVYTQSEHVLSYTHEHMPIG